MALRGRFGRLPRAAPSLTSTIVALAEQFQQAEDRNIETAWKQGGTYKGKQVTDAQFLAYWTKRRDGVDPQDPMWTYYDNLIYQYEFTIAESKMGQGYAEERITDAQMKAFYQKWAAKLPKDSEAYRQLMTQAAKFKGASGARGRGSGAASAEKAYQAAQQKNYKENELPFETLTSWVMDWARSRNIIPAELGQNQTRDMKDSGFSLMVSDAVNDPMNFSALLTDLNNDPDSKKAMSDYIFKTTGYRMPDELNHHTLNTMWTMARNGAGKSERMAVTAGRKEDANNARDRETEYNSQGPKIAISLGAGPMRSYVELDDYYRSKFDTVLYNPNSTPLEIHAAGEEYKRFLEGTGKNMLKSLFPKGALNPNSREFNASAAGIEATRQSTVDMLNGKITGPTNKDDIFGTEGGNVGETSDAYLTGNKMADAAYANDQIANGTGILVQTDGKGHPTPDGSGWEVFDRNDPLVKGNDNLVPIQIPARHQYGTEDTGMVGGQDGETRYVVARPVKAAGYQYQDPNTGAFTGKLPYMEGTDPNIGKFLSYIGPDGVRQTSHGSYQNGRLVWTQNDPYAPGTKSVPQPDGSIEIAWTKGLPPGSPDAVDPNLAGAEQKLVFGPQTIYAPGMLDGPSTRADFNPLRDYQMTWDSASESIYNGSSPNIKWATANLGDRGIRAGEREYYKDPAHWTPQMREQLAKSGAVPGTPEFENAVASVIAIKADQVSTNLARRQKYGSVPEQPDMGRVAEWRAWQAARGSTPLGHEIDTRTKAQRENDRRASLIGMLDDWGIDGIKKGADPTAFAPGESLASRTIDALQGNQGLPKGWTAQQLLSQPGMNTDAASDLAYRISKGKVGMPWSERDPASKVLLPLLPFPITIGGGVKDNPFMPKKGELPGMNRSTTHGGWGPSVPTTPQTGPGQFRVAPPGVGPRGPEGPEPVIPEEEIEEFVPNIPVGHDQRAPVGGGRTDVLRGGH